MIVIGWAATLVGLITAGALTFTPVGEASAWLALIFLVAFLVAVWGFGAFHRNFWITDIDSTHPDALGSLDIRDGLTQPPTGDAASPSADAPNVPASPVGFRREEAR